ncbi:YiiX/YebB-like N1pC/P60 family cysteine hydrolase, partial [Akkermansiaceae bacterium]|nr:YiiX/YebB-like N1pC/P60 family cysteine hydrolase [Akkermansiaceae bacterium]
GSRELLDSVRFDEGLTWSCFFCERVEVEIREAWRILQSVRPALPQSNELEQEVSDALAAQERGYYLPDEDERVREVYSRYLAARGTLWEMVLAMKPRLKVDGDEEERMQVFGLSFCAAAMLVRSANFVIGLAKERPVVWKKLDEAEPRYQLERKTFTRLYRNLSSLRWMWYYHDAWRFYEREREAIWRSLENGGMSQVVLWLKEEEPFIEKSRGAFVRRRFAYRLHSFVRRHVSGYGKAMFGLFELGGSAVAELKQPFKKRGRVNQGKRVDEVTLEKARGLLRAGDVIVTRHDDALSNLFLPGYWPHGALYIGSLEEREVLGADVCARSGGHISVLEAKKDGVLFRELRETLAVDAFLVLRPKIARKDLRVALERAMTHEGKLYDFVFDFRTADRLVCTEVVYRAYHGVGDFSFELSQRSGRHCLSAEDLIKQGVTKGMFEVLMCFGVEDDTLRHGEVAHSRVMASLRKFGAAE